MRSMLVDWYVWHVSGKWYDSSETKDWLAQVPGFTPDSTVLYPKNSES